MVIDLMFFTRYDNAPPDIKGKKILFEKIGG